MRHTIVYGLIALLSSFFVAQAYADTYVRGYVRKDGIYVAPHYRSSPDRNYNNNWSVSPNVNPYTGQRGTRSPTLNNQPPRKADHYRSYQQRRSGYR